MYKHTYKLCVYIHTYTCTHNIYTHTHTHTHDTYIHKYIWYIHMIHTHTHTHSRRWPTAFVHNLPETHVRQTAGSNPWAASHGHCRRRRYQKNIFFFEKSHLQLTYIVNILGRWLFRNSSAVSSYRARGAAELSIADRILVKQLHAQEKNFDRHQRHGLRVRSSLHTLLPHTLYYTT